MITAMLCAATVTAQFIAGKATRDALFLANLDVTTLPSMVVATAILSIGLVAASSKGLQRIPPSSFVPAVFAASAALLLVEWLLVQAAPRLAAVVVYLQISGVGPMLGSGFWLIASERFDPRTAKRRFGQIAAAGTLGGLAGGLVAERVAVLSGVAAMLPVLALLNAVCAWLMWRLAASTLVSGNARADVPPDLAAQPARSGLRVLHDAPYLRNLAALVLLGTFAAALLDYLFKAQAVVALGRGDGLLRFFATYYSAVSLITFALQAVGSRFALERLGLAATSGTPSLAVVIGGVAGLAAPGFTSLMLARGAESVFRGGFFRSGYELFYTPIAASEKRAAKSLIDVGADRLGDALGGGTIQLMLVLLAPIAQYSAILALAVGSSCLALVVASRLSRGYIQTLERSLMNRALELDFSDLQDATTRTVMLRTIPGVASGRPVGGSTAPAGLSASIDPDVAEILALRSRDQERIAAVLRHDEGVPATLVPHVIPLLAWDAVSEDAVYALRKVAEERVGELIDALLDPNQPFAVRRRLARVFSVCVSQRAVDGLLLGLEDQRFEVRFQCGRSLAAIVEKNPRIVMDRERVYRVILREVAVGKPVWESHRLLDRLEPPAGRSVVDEFVRGRASQGLAHVFTLLSLVLPAEPLQVAYQGLHTADENLRGTALEYLEGVLPPIIRERLWPFLEDGRVRRPEARPRGEVLDALLRSHPSILLNLEELRRKAAAQEPVQPS